MKKKTWIMAGAILAAVVAAVAGFVILKGGKQESYRSIMVYQVNGSVSITRERVGAMDAYENLMLLSGDIVEVAQDSNVRLKLDDDKYLLAEPDTVICIKAEGDADNSKTYIDLQKGAVTNEIQNKLGSGSSYEVNTPNSIMAVRGTVFRVALAQTENGEFETKVDVFDGAVKVNPVLPDGTVSKAEAAVEAGKEIIIGPEQVTSEQISEPVDIDYENLPPVMQEYLIELAQKENVLPANVINSIQEAQQSESWTSDGGKNADNETGRNDTELKQSAEETQKEDNPAAEEQKKPDDGQANQQNVQQQEANKPNAAQEQQAKIEEQKKQEELQQQQQEDLARQQQEALLKQQEELVRQQQEALLKQQEELVRQQQEALLKQQEEAKKQQESAQQNQPSGEDNNSGGGENNSSSNNNSNNSSSAPADTKNTGSAIFEQLDWLRSQAAMPPADVGSDTNGTSNITYYYKKKGAGDDTYSQTKPSAPGQYTAKAVFAETDVYAAVEVTDDFIIEYKGPEYVIYSGEVPLAAGDDYADSNDYIKNVVDLVKNNPNEDAIKNLENSLLNSEQYIFRYYIVPEDGWKVWLVDENMKLKVGKDGNLNFTEAMQDVNDFPNMNTPPHSITYGPMIVAPTLHLPPPEPYSEEPQNLEPNSEEPQEQEPESNSEQPQEQEPEPNSEQPQEQEPEPNSEQPQEQEPMPNSEQPQEPMPTE